MRAEARVAFGLPLAKQGVICDWIAEARVRVDQLRLLMLKAAWLMDTRGQQGRLHKRQIDDRARRQRGDDWPGRMAS